MIKMAADDDASAPVWQTLKACLGFAKGKSHTTGVSGPKEIVKVNMTTTQYIYEIPFLVRSELCQILNQDNKWEELAGTWMGYNVSDLQNLRKVNNPTDELLTMWSHHNHLIIELFILLARMEHYQAMKPLLPLVDSKYHRLFHMGEGNLQHLFEQQQLKKNTKDLKIGLQNFNQNPNMKEKVVKNVKKESEKILNQPYQFEQQNETPSISNNLLAAVPTIFSSSLPRIPYNELAAATGNWRRENLLGKGGFGTVFKGIWKNTDVAIKKIEPRGTDFDESYALQLEQSFREIKILNSTPHENILPLYGYSIGGGREAPCLVYQCMINGSLEDRLHLKYGTAPLNWLQRQEIAKGTARGLQYLHSVNKEKPLIHGDIKSANILLDKNFEPKIGDFGLAREGSSDDAMKVSRVQGTRPYLPKEYINDRILSTKIDTYSYGIVLFELATGLPAYDKLRPIYNFLKDYVSNYDETNLHNLKDKRAGDKYDEVFQYLILLGKWCTNKKPEDRPEMSTVFEKFTK